MILRVRVRVRDKPCTTSRARQIVIVIVIVIYQNAPTRPSLPGPTQTPALALSFFGVTHSTTATVVAAAAPIQAPSAA